MMLSMNIASDTLYSLDDEEPTTLADFMLANAECPVFDEADLERVAAMVVGDVLNLDAGAGGVFTFRRVR